MVDPVLAAHVQKLRTVCLFAGDIVPTDHPEYKSLGWRSGRNVESDKTGPVFSYERVLAAAVLWRMNPSLVIIPSGGKSNLEGFGESPPISTVVAFELENLGVPKEAILEEPNAFTSVEQVVRCSAKLREYGILGNVAILAPCWQFARITAVISALPTTWTTGWMTEDIPLTMKATSFLSIERVLAAEDPSWNQRFVEWYADPNVQAMFAKEALGAGQLWTGHQPKFPNPFRGFNDPLGTK